MADSASAGAAGASGPRLEPATLVLLGLLTLLWTWWALKEGAYFGVVLLPGTIVLCAGAALLAGFAPWRADLRLSRPTAIALAALTGLGVWTLLSAIWSPTPDIAVADGQRVLVYAFAFWLGLWLCNLLGRRMSFSLLPLAVAAAVAGTVTAVSMAVGDVPGDLLKADGRLTEPLGYHNATAAFFAIAGFPAVGLAADRDLDWRLRGLALGTATLCLDLLLVVQSRASIPALILAMAVFVVVSPVRLRALGWLALAILPVLAFVVPGTEIYRAVSDAGLANAGGEMNSAGVAAAGTALAGVALGAICARLDSRLPILGATGSGANRAVVLGLAAAALLAAAGFVIAVGNPVSWIDDRLDEFRSGEPDLSEASSRFTFNAGTDRGDLWRVALDDAADDPLLGEGSGGFGFSYTLKRDVGGLDVRDAHSVELEVLSELGVPGLVLLLAALGGAFAGVVRARRASTSAAALGAVALASGTYWLIHASVDWFWTYPAVTAPVLALLGSACAPALSAVGERSSRLWRWGLITAAVVLALSAVSPFLAERFVNQAYAGWRENLQQAYDDLDSAASLNRLSDLPPLAEGVIAREAGDRERALDAFRAAEEKRPEEWATHHLLAQLQARSDPQAARREISIALELNPLGPRVRSLAERLGVDPDAPAGEG